MLLCLSGCPGTVCGRRGTGSVPPGCSVPDWPSLSVLGAALLVPVQSAVRGLPVPQLQYVGWALLAQAQEGSLKQKDFVNGQVVKKDH